MKEFVTPRALETAEIPAVVEQFGEAARLAMEADVDGVEIHAANGYLPNQFLSDGDKLRTDAYGGSVPKRIRFVLEVTEAVVSVGGASGWACTSRRKTHSTP